MALEGGLIIQLSLPGWNPSLSWGRDSWKDQLTLLSLEDEYDWRVPACNTPGDVLSPSQAWETLTHALICLASSGPSLFSGQA